MAPSRTSLPSAENEAIPHLMRFGVAALATWRLTHLLANEDGPADVIARTREALGDSPLGSLMDCFHCTSIWVALPFACYVAKRPGDRLAAWLALSAAACLLQETSKDLPPEVNIKSGDQHELLR